MSRIVHLSDLHFGKDRPDLLEPLLEAVNRLSADMVAISGDLTQRARATEFASARRFIDRVEAPVLCVPGNHDVPIHRPLTRFFLPWRYFKKFIARDLTPVHEGLDYTVIGVNTVDPLSWQTGRMSDRRIRKACRALEGVDDHKARILVAHHPLNHPQETKKRPIPGADRALNKLLACGADLVLSGHLHTWHVGEFARGEEGGAAVQLHAGTSLSSRLRGEPNDFNLIDISPDCFEISRIAYADETKTFETTETRHFDRVSQTVQPATD
jgi:3',5'-cyclic AMP phosphodiesterase CpdA